MGLEVNIVVTMGLAVSAEIDLSVDNGVTNTTVSSV